MMMVFSQYLHVQMVNLPLKSTKVNVQRAKLHSGSLVEFVVKNIKVACTYIYIT